MGLAYARIELISNEDVIAARRGNLPETRVRRTTVTALVDTGAMSLAIPTEVRDQLGLLTVGEAEVELADGSIETVDLVGPVEIHFENRRAVLEALVMPSGTEVLLGVIPLEAMDLLVDPVQQRLVVNPKSPDRARLFLK